MYSGTICTHNGTLLSRSRCWRYGQICRCVKGRSALSTDKQYHDYFWWNALTEHIGMNNNLSLATTSKNSRILLELSKDTNKHVRAAVGENLYAPLAALEALARDKSEDVREAVARNKGVPPHILVNLAQDKSWYVRLTVASVGSTPPDVLVTLAREDDVNIREAVASNPSAPLKLLRKLAKNSDWTIRLGVAYNPSVSSDILTLLANDKDWSVSSKARKRLSSLLSGEKMQAITEQR